MILSLLLNLGFCGEHEGESPQRKNSESPSYTLEAIGVGSPSSSGGSPTPFKTHIITDAHLTPEWNEAFDQSIAEIDEEKAAQEGKELEIENLRKKINSMVAEHDASQSVLKRQHEDHVAQLQSDLEKLESSSTGNTTTINQLKEELADAKEAQNLLLQELEQTTASLTEVQNTSDCSVEQLTAKIAQLAASNAKLKRRNKAFEEKAEKYKEAYVDSQNKLALGAVVIEKIGKIDPKYQHISEKFNKGLGS